MLHYHHKTTQQHNGQMHSHAHHGHHHGLHTHGHDHSFDINQNSLNKSFIIGIILNSLFVITEFIVGTISNSVGLISDAGHNLSDVASLILAMLAFKLAKTRTNKKYTYGYKKMTIHVSLINAVILIVAVIFIISESIHKLFVPQIIEGKMICITATIGVFINGLTAWLFIKDKEKDLNVKGAYLHMAADALVSVGVVISGIIIMMTDIYWIDSIIGLIVAIIIIYSSFNLLHKSVRLTLDGVPEEISFTEITEGLKLIPDVEDVHHIHIWAISTTENALTAHISVNKLESMETVKKQIKYYLKQHNITHSTLEFEINGKNCTEKDCNCITV